jgi:hypothetical protein
MDIDREVLADLFRARVELAKRTEDEAAEDAREEHRKNLAWFRSNRKDEGSFLWHCDEFDYEPSAVRRELGVK